MIWSLVLQVKDVLIVLDHAKIHAQDLVLVVVLALEVEEVAIHATVTALVRVKVVLELVAIVLADAQEGVMENVQNHVILPVLQNVWLVAVQDVREVVKDAQQVVKTIVTLRVRELVLT